MRLSGPRLPQTMQAIGYSYQEYFIPYRQPLTFSALLGGHLVFNITE
jgi:hypothetical protein